VAYPPKPPSSSGLGHRPFKAAARVRIPLGAQSFPRSTPDLTDIAGFEPVWVRYVPLFCSAGCSAGRPRF
jgi:hypothetical protein